MSSEIILDKWSEKYSERAGSMVASEVRTLFAATERTDIISFAGGMPDTRIFPIKLLLDATKRATAKNAAAALQYGTSDGYLGLRKKIVKILKDEGIIVGAEEVIITDGAQQAIEFLSKIFLDPGDTIIIESPSFVGAIQAFKGYQPDIVEIPMDKDGMMTDVLAKELTRLKKANKLPKFIYTICNFHNPAGVTLSLERRKEMVALANKFGVLIIEDDPYGRVRFDGESIPPMRSMDPNVIYLGTFSKVFAPGIRLGYCTAPAPILEKLNLAKQAANLCSSSLTQRITEELLKKDNLEKMISRYVKVYRERRDVMVEALNEHFPPEAKFNVPAGGLFIWVELPEYLKTKELLADSIREAKVIFVPGNAFYAKGHPGNGMRLNFSFCDKDMIREGIKRLGKVIKYQMDLYRSVTKDL